jgi:hypothetical protein
VTQNNVTIGSLSPYLAAEGAFTPFFRYYVGWRRDEISFADDDLLTPQNSFHHWRPKPQFLSFPENRGRLALRSASEKLSLPMIPGSKAPTPFPR